MAGMSAGNSLLGRAAACAGTLALAVAFTMAPAIIGFANHDGAAMAKNGNSGGNGRGGGNGGGRGGDQGAERGGKGADKGNRGNGWGRDKARKGGVRGNSSNHGQSKKAARSATADAETVYEDQYGEDLGDLSADQRGRWNAARANQAAFDAHIRKQKFNGTIGALSQYQLAGKAAAGEPLSPEEQAALDSFVGASDPVSFTDAELEDVLNGPAVEGEPVFEVRDGVASCVDNCGTEGFDPETIDADANAALDGYREAGQMAADRQAIDDFYSASEQRILDESNKSTSGIEDALLDDIAHDLGFERPEPEPIEDGDGLTGDTGEDATAAEAVEDSEIPGEDAIVLVD